ncbi:UDP-galactose transporter Gms1 [Collariella sp. IMI 366227]|nr:UDP-galactose transporter Gms1 [Collariella sp. IMI 366227]
MLAAVKSNGEPGPAALDTPMHMPAPSRRWQLSVQRISLALLVIQNSVLVLVMHHSRNKPTGKQPRYLASTAILLVELIKLVASLLLAICDTLRSYRDATPSQQALHLYRSIFSRDSWKLIVPAALYTLQNSLVYAAISNLPAVTFQVTYQLKILTTVLFSILLLARSVSLRQWLALILLTFGVALLPRPLHPPHPSSNAFKGLLSVLAASLTSGLTCVYFEKLVKDSLASVSLWTRNVQLSFFSLFPALFVGVLWQDGGAVRECGFFAGYNSVVWTTVLLQAVGGLVVAVCIAYADNVAKNFAASLSIVAGAADGVASSDVDGAGRKMKFPFPIPTSEQ